MHTPRDSAGGSRNWVLACSAGLDWVPSSSHRTYLQKEPEEFSLFSNREILFLKEKRANLRPRDTRSQLTPTHSDILALTCPGPHVTTCLHALPGAGTFSHHHTHTPQSALTLVGDAGVDPHASGHLTSSRLGSLPHRTFQSALVGTCLVTLTPTRRTTHPLGPTPRSHPPRGLARASPVVQVQGRPQERSGGGRGRAPTWPGRTTAPAQD